MYQEWRGRTFADVIDYAERTWPERIAVTDGDFACTYADLGQRIRRLALALRDLGVKEGDHVAHLMGANRDWIEIFYATLCLGATLVPLNLVWEADEIAAGLERTRSRYLLVGGLHRGRPLLDRIEKAFPEMRIEVPAGRDMVSVIALKSPEMRALPLAALVEAVQDDRVGALKWPVIKSSAMGLLLLTSGSTALPKPAIHTHETMLAGIASYADGLEINREDIFLQTTPNYHVSGIITMVGPMLRGGRVRVLEWFDAGEAMRIIDQERITLFWGFDTHFAMMREHESYGKYDLSSVTRTMVAGNPGTFDAIRGMGFRHIGSLYGSTEYMGAQAFFPYRDRFDIERMKHSNGRPTSGEIAIIDPETNRPCAPEVPGEICVRGPSLFKGYFGMPDETRDAFDANGFFRSGDIGWLDEQGYLYYRGRYKEMIKTGGENVSALEVEAFLLSHFPEIRRAIVCATPHRKWGECVTALVETHAGAGLTTEGMVTRCRGALAGYKIPKLVLPLRNDDWIVTPTGKVDRNAMQRLATGRLGQGAA